jgi:hypothetical protein
MRTLSYKVNELDETMRTEANWKFTRCGLELSFAPINPEGTNVGDVQSHGSTHHVFQQKRGDGRVYFRF